MDAAGLVGIADVARPPRHRGLAAVGAPAGHPGDDGDDDGPPHPGPRPARDRHQQPAGGRGLVRPAVPAPAGAHPGVRRHPAQGHRPRGAGHATTASTTSCRWPGGTGLGKPLRSILHPYRTEIPVYLGAEGPKNVALAAEIADGWNAMFFSPAMNDFYAAALAEGFARPAPATRQRDLRRGGRPARHRSRRRHRARRRPAPAVPRPLHRRHGRPRPATSTTRSSPGWATRRRPGRSRTHYLAGDKKSAIAAVPTRMVEDVALIGPWAKIADEIQRWKADRAHDVPGQLRPGACSRRCWI